MAELRGCTFPEHLRYHPESHLWFEAVGDGTLHVGVTPFGVAIAGEILLFTAKPVDLSLSPGRAFGLLEAGKTVFPVKTPIAARLVESNPALRESARQLNHSACETWLVRLAPTEDEDLSVLLAWCDAREAIERQMELWRFEHLSDFTPPLVGEGAKGTW